METRDRNMEGGESKENDGDRVIKVKFKQWPRQYEEKRNQVAQVVSKSVS